MDKFLDNRFKKRISTKFISYVTMLLIFIVVSLTFISIRNMELQIVDELSHRATLLNKLLTVEITRDFLQSDYNNVQNVLQETIRFDEEIRSIEFIDEDFMITNSTLAARRQKKVDDPIFKKAREQRTEVMERSADGLRLVFPLIIGKSVKGYMCVVYSFEKMHKEIHNLRLAGLLIFLLTLTTGIIFSFTLARTITAPIKKLLSGANEIINGNFSYRIELDTNDETVIISRAFNEVTSTLVEKIQALKENSAALITSNHELDKKIQELKSLQELGKVISSIFNREELLRAIVQNATMVMKSHRCSVILVDPRSGDYFIKVGKGIAEDLDVVENIRLKSGGIVTDYCVTHKESLLVTDLHADPRFNLPPRDGDSKDKYKTASFVAVPLIVNTRVLGVISITDKMSGESYTQSDLHLLTIFANQVVIAIENAGLHERVVERERLEKELEIAHTIQMNMLPEDYPVINNLAISGISMPAKEVGGDYYDFLPITDKIVGVTIGDVSGKGVPAALMMVMIRSILRARIMRDSNPEQIATELNTHILKESDEKMFVTLFYAVIDTETREMRYTNAGHNYPIVFHEDNEEFESLEDGGLLMGMFEQATYQEGKLTLRVGDVVCFYTDGIVEAMNDDNEMYGFERLCELVQMHKEKEAHAIRDIIMEDTTLFMGMSPQYDDITVIVIKVNHDAIEITENNNKIALNV